MCGLLAACEREQHASRAARARGAAPGQHRDGGKTNNPLSHAAVHVAGATGRHRRPERRQTIRHTPSHPIEAAAARVHDPAARTRRVGEGMAARNSWSGPAARPARSPACDGAGQRWSGGGGRGVWICWPRDDLGASLAGAPLAADACKISTTLPTQRTLWLKRPTKQHEQSVLRGVCESLSRMRQRGATGATAAVAPPSPYTRPAAHPLSSCHRIAICLHTPWLHALTQPSHTCPWKLPSPTTSLAPPLQAM